MAGWYFTSFAALAEFERDLIRERTQAGLHAARARRGGRPPVMTPEKLAVARQLYDAKQHTTAQIAQLLRVSRTSLYRHLSSTASTRSPPRPGAARPTTGRGRDGY